MRHFTPDFERNISDDIAKAVAAKGGVIQIPFGTAFIDPASAADTQARFRAIDERRPLQGIERSPRPSGRR